MWYPPLRFHKNALSTSVAVMKAKHLTCTRVEWLVVLWYAGEWAQCLAVSGWNEWNVGSLGPSYAITAGATVNMKGVSWQHGSHTTSERNGKFWSPLTACLRGVWREELYVTYWRQCLGCICPVTHTFKKNSHFLFLPIKYRGMTHFDTQSSALCSFLLPVVGIWFGLNSNSSIIVALPLSLPF